MKPVTFKYLPFPTKEDVIMTIMLIQERSWDNKRVSELTNVLGWQITPLLDLFGANIGTYTLPIAALGNDVVTVDAVFEHAARIHKAASLSKATDPITMLVNAVSDHHGIADVIKTTNGNPGAAHIKNVQLEA